VIWAEFGHRPKTNTITAAMLALMENEVPGPRLPGQLPLATTSYFRRTAYKTALERIKNYSQQEIALLLPVQAVVLPENAERVTTGVNGLTQESYLVVLPENAERVTTGVNGLTQESYLVQDNSSDQDFLDQDWGNDGEDGEGNLFASSLEVEDLSLPEVASARDILKPQINDVLQCLDALKSKASIDKLTKLLNDFANELRLELATAQGPKRNIQNCMTVNMNVEENSYKKRRTFASKNC
jgi:hypothetical protein